MECFPYSQFALVFETRSLHCAWSVQVQLGWLRLTGPHHILWDPNSGSCALQAFDPMARRLSPNFIVERHLLILPFDDTLFIFCFIILKRCVYLYICSCVQGHICLQSHMHVCIHALEASGQPCFYNTVSYWSGTHHCRLGWLLNSKDVLSLIL